MPVDAITVVGPGRLGGALSLALSNSGTNTEEIVYRSRYRARALAALLDPHPEIISIDKLKKIRSPILIIAVQDEEILKVVRLIAGSLDGVKTVFHTSGSMSSDVLDDMRSPRRSVASIHPLASISNWSDGQDRFKGSFFCVEGDAKAVRVGKRLVSQLGGRSISIDSAQKSLYHAAALTAAGHVTALFDIAVGFMIKTGVDRRIARRMLQPLLAGVSLNLANQDTDEALTGTYARADGDTMERHLKALRSAASDDELKVYLELALRSIDLAKQAGADVRRLARMRKSIIVAKQKLGC